MSFDWLSIVLGFSEGFILIVSPCILPILPIIFAISLTGSRNRPFGVMTGFIVVFSLLVFFSRQLIHVLHLDFNMIRSISFGILFLLGLVMLFPAFSRMFGQVTHRLVYFNRMFQSMSQRTDFWSGFILGGLVSIVWVPCAGPILASVIVQSVIQKTTIMSFFILLAFGFGVFIPMLTLVFCGQEIMSRLSFLKKRANFLRQGLAIFIIVSVMMMVYQEKYTDSSVIETTIKTEAILQKGLWRPYPAPEIKGITRWINTPPLTLNALKGRVVLIDFWTYSCINCLRTLPYLKAFYQKYHDKGLTIIGIHSPEFDFEKDFSRVKASVDRLGIAYPVALDNQFITWQRFHNHFWPTVYLINQQGQVVYEHFGEGDENVIENNIRFLLQFKRDVSTLAKRESTYLGQDTTQEMYLGYNRAAQKMSPPFLIHDKMAHYQFPAVVSINTWALQGMWQVLPNQIRASSMAQLTIHFQARFVYVVMGSLNKKPIDVRACLNEKVCKTIQVNQHMNYQVMALPQLSQGLLTLSTRDEGLEVFTVTFGH